jgi:hypothetical protein
MTAQQGMEKSSRSLPKPEQAHLCRLKENMPVKGKKSTQITFLPLFLSAHNTCSIQKKEN